MKKFIIFVFLIFVCANQNIFKASENQINYSTSYVKDYYIKLDENGFKNFSNSICGYQALANLICYWDNYWNESFIEDNLDRKASVNGLGFVYYDDIDSPGMNNYEITYEHFSDPNFPYYSDYNNTGAISYNTKRLIYASKVYKGEFLENGFNKFNLYGSILNSISSAPITVNNYSSVFYLNGLPIENVFNIYNNYFQYLDINTSFSQNDYNFIYDYSIVLDENIVTIGSLRNDVINYLEEGYPVICFIASCSAGIYDVSNFNSQAHFMVCYEYDSINDKIYGYTDYLNNDEMILSPHYDIDRISDDICIAGYYLITPKTSASHICTGAYYNDESFEETVYYCPHEILSHEHTINATSTIHQCTYDGCGLNEMHYGTYTQKNKYSHYTHCVICDETYIMSHDFVQVGNHMRCRLCGFTQNSSDVIIYKKEEEELL